VDAQQHREGQQTAIGWGPQVAHLVAKPGLWPAPHWPPGFSTKMVNEAETADMEALLNESGSPGCGLS
jgi:hypothetical protein